MATEIGNLRTKLSFDKTGDSNLTELTRDLKGVRSEMNNFRATGRAYRTSVKGMKEESDILSRRLQVQRERVAELARRYEESKRVNGENAAATKDLAAQYNNAQAQAKNTEEQLARLNEIIRTQESRWTKLGDAMIKSGDKLKTFGTATSRFGRQYTMRVTTPILAAGAAALKVGMDFEEGMSKVEAISGATGDDLEALKELAKEMGATTRFSATQAAEGLEYMALAGWETQEMLDGLPGVLDLAAASGEDLGRTSDIVTDGLSAFGMKAKESGRFADVLAAASANANTDVSGLGAAFQYVAPVAGALNFTIEDTATAIGLMSDNGIKGQKAGTALRTMMTNLAKPTEAMQEEMEKLNISLTDGEGEMKSFDAIMSDLRKGFDGLTEEQKASAAATIFGKQAMSGALAIIGSTDDEYNKLSKSIADSEGAASEMAEVMQDNAKGAMIEFKSALEGVGIEIAEHLLPVVTDLTHSATDLVRKFGDLDEEQQKQIIKWAGIAAAVGPAAIVLGHTATGLGNVLTFGGKVSKMLGRASGTGLVGRLGMLGGPVGLGIVGGIAAIGGGIYAMKKHTEKAKEVNIEFADSLSEEALQLETTASAFDELSEKSGLTNDQLARLYELNKKISESINPGEIKELQEEYDKLSEKSGLTKDELIRLFEANDEIIKQAPDVKTSVTETGDEFLNTEGKINGASEAVAEYVEGLREMSEIELEIERVKLLENEKELMEDIAEAREKVQFYEEGINTALDLRNLSEDELRERMKENLETMEDLSAESSKHVELGNENNTIRAMIKKGVAETLEDYKESREENQKTVESLEENKKKLDEIDTQMMNIYLRNVGITEEGEKGLEQLDKNIDSNQKKIEKLDEQLEKNGKLTQEEQEQYDSLVEQLQEQENVKDKIFEQLGLYSDIDTLNSDQIETLKGQGQQFDINNRKLDGSIDRARDQHDMLTKPATKLLTVDDNGTIKSVNDRATEPKTKGIGLVAPGLTEFNRKVTEPVTKTVRLAASGMQGIVGTMRAYATGTDSHPGGPFIAGEEGWELGRLGNRWEMLNFGMYDRPRGYEVFPHNESKQIMKAMNNIPKYASGTPNRSMPSNDDSLLSATLEQNKLLTALLEKDNTAVIGFKEVYDPIKKQFDRDKYAQSKRRRR